MASPLIWYEASAEAYSNNATATTFHDQSGNGFDLTATGTPTFKTNIVNGQPAILFNGSTDYYTRTGVGPFGDFSAFVVVDTLAGGDYGLVCEAAGGIQFVRYGQGPANVITAYDGTGVTSTTLPTAQGTWILLEVVRSGTGFSFYANGTAVGTGTGSGAGMSFGELGGVAGAVILLNGYIAEVTLFNSALNTTDRQTEETRLIAKYAIGGGGGSITGFTDAAGTTITHVPSNHGAGTIVVKVVGSGTNFQAGDTWTASNSGGSWSYASKVVNSTTSVTLTLNCPAAATPPVGATGTLTITNTTLSLSNTLTVSAPTISLSVTSGTIGGTQAETVTGANTLWANETASGLITLSGGTGASISDPPTVASNTSLTNTITKGSTAAALTITDTSTGATATFTVSGTFTIAPTAIPKNHSGHITLTLTGSGTSWNNSTTIFTPSGVTGVTKISQNVTSATAATVVVTTDATHTGTLTITESVTGTATATTTVATATLAISPTTGTVSTTPTLTLTGANTVWSQETPTGLFTVSGGIGVSIGTPTITTNTAGTVVLTTGSANDTLTITDTSTGATATFTVSGATAFTLTGPSAGPVGAASSEFTVTPNGATTGTFTPTPATGCTFTPSTLTLSGTTPETFTVTKSGAGTVNINGTTSDSLTPPANVSYTAKTTTTRTYTVTGGIPATTTGFTAKNLDSTLWADRTTSVTDQGGGVYSIGSVVVPADFSGIVVWDQGSVFASEPMDNRPAGSGGVTGGNCRGGFVN